MKKKIIAIMLVLLLICLTACNTGSGNGVSSNASASDNNSGTDSQEEGGNATAEDNDPFGKYENPVVLKIGRSIDPLQVYPEGQSPESNQYTDYIKEQLNIEIEVIWSAAAGNDYKQKVNLAIASNDLPDAMVVENAQMRNAVKADQLEDLTKAFDDYVSPVVKSFFDATDNQAVSDVTFDGKMVAYPNTSVAASGIHNMWIRQDWLDELGLEAPKTIEELKAVAQAFLDNDMAGGGNTIPIAGPDTNGKLYANFLASGNNTYGFDPIFSAFQSYPGYWIHNENGEVVYGSITSETKDALAALADLYASGLIDKEIGIRERTEEIVKAGKTGMFFGPWHAVYSWLDVVQADPTVNWQSYLLPLDSDGEVNLHMNAVTFSYCVVRKGYEHPEAVIKMANLLVRDEQTFDVSVLPVADYPLRVNNAVRDECEFTVSALRDVLNGDKTLDDFTDLEKQVYKLLVSDINAVKGVKTEPYDDMNIANWNFDGDNSTAWGRTYALLVGCGPIVDTEYNEVYSLLYAQTPLMESRWVNLKKLEDETFLKIIMGIEPVDSFDAFVDEWLDIGGADVTAEVADTVS